MNLSLIYDHLVFKGYNLKWRNTRSVLQCHSFRSHVLQNYNMCCIKSRHGVLESNFSLWYSTSTDHRSNKIQMFSGQLLHFCKNCIACASCWIPASVLVFPFAVITPVLFACLFCSKEKIVAYCYTFQSTILQQQFWNQTRKLNYQASYTQCDYSQWQCRSKNILKLKSEFAFTI